MEKIGFYSGFENPLEGFSTGGTLSPNGLSSVRRLGVFPGAIKTPASSSFNLYSLTPSPAALGAE